MKWLIITADDFGISRGINRGIVEALKTRKPEAAVAAARKHLEQVRRTTLDEMDPQ